MALRKPAKGKAPLLRRLLAPPERGPRHVAELGVAEHLLVGQRMQLDGLQHLHGVFFRHLHADVLEPHVDRVDAAALARAARLQLPVGLIAPAGESAFTPFGDMFCPMTIAICD